MSTEHEYALTWDEALDQQAELRRHYGREEWFIDVAIVILGDAKYDTRLISRKV